MARRSLCPVCFDVLPGNGACVKQCAWPPQNSMKVVPRIASKDEFLDIVSRSYLGRPTRPPACTSQNEPECMPAAAFGCLTDDVLSSTATTLRQMLLAAEREIATRQLREDAKRNDVRFALFLSKIQPASGPRYASDSKEIETVASETMELHHLDVGECLRTLGFENCRRMRCGRNTYFYKFQFDFSRHQFVRVVNNSGRN